jgi:hypothetical protein
MIDMTAPDQNAAPAEQPKAMDREQPEVDENTKKHVEKWIGKCQAAWNHWTKEAFDPMKLDMEYAYQGCDPEKWNSLNDYTVPVIGRHINQSVASLYAKNPKAVAKRKPRLEFKLWDGKAESLQMAQQQIQLAQQAAAIAPPTIDPLTGQAVAAQPMVDPNAMALVQDVQEGMMRKQLLDRTGKTLEILFNYFTAEQEPNFKKQMKQLVRRTKICGVGYVVLGFQRLTEKTKDPSAEIKELQDAIAALQEEETVIVREGLTFGFPRANEIIPDHENTRNLNGWIGAEWLAEVFDMTADRVKEVYKKDIGGKHTEYTDGGRTDVNQALVNRIKTGDDLGQKIARVYRVWDKVTGTVFTICEGYCDYLDPPAAPKIKLERFFPVFALTFNDVEHAKKLFPPSDVRELRHPQDEYNSSRQGMREHRQANRPGYVTGAGKLTEADREKIRNRKPHDIMELNAIEGQQKAADLFAAMPMTGIDPNLYTTEPAMQDILRSVGAQEANIGGTSGASATESSIAEASRSSALQSNVDDLDEFLSELARNGSQILLMNMSPGQVMEIVGPGCSWPELSREETAKELYLDIKAGSSGRPNRAMELANMERALPQLLQIPGVNPIPLARKYCDLLDLDLDEMIVEGMPSIVAMNQMVGKAMGAGAGAADDPNAQGPQGGNNAEKPAQGNEGPQPEYPGPQAGLSRMIQYDAAGNPVGAQ